MTDQELIENTFKEIYDKGLEIIAKKGADYANEDNRFINFEKLANLNDLTPQRAFCFYLGIKIARLTELYKGKKQPKNESVEDTLLDLINYAVLFIAYNKKQM